MNQVQGFITAGALTDTVLQCFQRRLAASHFELPAGYRLA